VKIGPNVEHLLLFCRTGRLPSASAQEFVSGGHACASIAVAACDTTSSDELRCVLAASTACPRGSVQRTPPVSLLFHAGE